MNPADHTDRITKPPGILSHGKDTNFVRTDSAASAFSTSSVTTLESQTTGHSTPSTLAHRDSNVADARSTTLSSVDSFAIWSNSNPVGTVMGNADTLEWNLVGNVLVDKCQYCDAEHLNATDCPVLQAAAIHFGLGIDQVTAVLNQPKCQRCSGVGHIALQCTQRQRPSTPAYNPGYSYHPTQYQGHQGTHFQGKLHPPPPQHPPQHHNSQHATQQYSNQQNAGPRCFQCGEPNHSTFD
jgi:hypothetical protein